MPVWRLGPEPVFPPATAADPDGLLAVGGDLSAERLLRAYGEGIFPWYEEDPILWFSPDPRGVLPLSGLHLSRRLRRTLRHEPFTLSLDRAFPQVIRACAEARVGAAGTWITKDMIAAYESLHDLGLAHSVEAWEDGELVGGVYGVALGAAFFGESMFHRRSDASKVALAALVLQLEHWGFQLFDTQLPSDHLTRMGGESWTRTRFLRALGKALRRPTRRGLWQLDDAVSARLAGRVS